VLINYQQICKANLIYLSSQEWWCHETKSIH